MGLGLSSYCNVGGLEFKDITGFDTHIKEMPGHGVFDDTLVPVAYPGKADPVALFVFPDYIEIFNFACPAPNAVTLHVEPPYRTAGKNTAILFYYRELPVL